MKKIKSINRAIAGYTGLVAKWKREIKEGKADHKEVPEELLISMDLVGEEILNFRIKEAEEAIEKENENDD